jgi:V8-like Glu-specific endopeptidase
LALVLGCSSDHIDLPGFNDVTSAPAAIRRAARGVVLVGTAGAVATGSFVSESGVLLTNNHVLGDTVCPVEGCYVQLTWMYQRGEPRQQPQSVFAVPMAVNPGLDVAVVQLYAWAGGPKLSTPEHLTFRAVDPGSLLGTHVTVVGHPEGSLKKWTDGVVIDLDGNWFQSTAYILPGESGSPALDDGGNIVGIVHRGPTGEDLISSAGVNVYSVGTASGSIMAAMSMPLPTAMISTTAATTESAFLENDRVYLNAHVSTVTVESGPAAVLALLGQACDAGLAQQAYASPSDLDSALNPCYEASRWIDCRVDTTPAFYGVVCPSPSDAAAWANRFQSVNLCWRDMNGRLDLGLISFGIAALSGSMSAGKAAGALSLQQALSSAQPPLDFELAYYLAAFGITGYSGTRIVDYVKNYQAVSHYEYQATDVAAAAAWLYSNSALAKVDVLGLLSRLHDDPRVSVGTKLYIERVQYSFGAL